MEQFVRDARIAMIYEGANGIQALDLVGRKLPKDGGRAVTAFFGEVNGFLAENREDTALAVYTAPVKAAVAQLQQATMWLMANGMKNPDNAGAALERLHASVRPHRALLYVGEDRQGGAEAAGGRREHARARREAFSGAVLQCAGAAGRRRRIWRGSAAARSR